MIKKIFLLLILITGFSCTEKQKITSEEIKFFENEIEEKIDIIKTDIVYMKEDLAELSDSIKNNIAVKIDTFENQLDTVERNFEDLKRIDQTEIWQKQKSRVDSLIDYLNLDLNDTKVRIKKESMNK